MMLTSKDFNPLFCESDGKTVQCNAVTQVLRKRKAANTIDCHCHTSNWAKWHETQRQVSRVQNGSWLQGWASHRSESCRWCSPLRPPCDFKVGIWIVTYDSPGTRVSFAVQLRNPWMKLNGCWLSAKPTALPVTRYCVAIPANAISLHEMKDWRILGKLETHETEIRRSASTSSKLIQIDSNHLLSFASAPSSAQAFHHFNTFLTTWFIPPVLRGPHIYPSECLQRLTLLNAHSATPHAGTEHTGIA